jgi:hypothetical protein
LGQENLMSDNLISDTLLSAFLVSIAFTFIADLIHLIFNRQFEANAGQKTSTASLLISPLLLFKCVRLFQMQKKKNGTISLSLKLTIIASALATIGLFYPLIFSLALAI